MRKRVVSAIAILGISLLVGCGQVSETPDAGEVNGVVEQEGKTDKEDTSAGKDYSSGASDKEAEPTAVPKIESDTFTYQWKKDGTLKITGLKVETPEKIDIPEKISGIAVTEIGVNAFDSRYDELTSITIPEGVTTIGDGAFRGSSSLTSISIPDSVIEIGAYAFEETPWLNEKRSESPVIIGKVLLEAQVSGEYVIPEGVTYIAGAAFYGCRDLTNITIPEGVTGMGKQAFEDCRALTSIAIPESVTSIGDTAFAWCDSLTSITLPKGLTEISARAFQGCSGLTSVIIPDGVTEISADAFAGCVGLTNVTIPESVTKIGDGAFALCSALTSIVIPKGVTEIGKSMFRKCSSLTSISLPESVVEIDGSAFEGCPNLTIHCPAGSYAETYAKDKGIKYVTE